MQSAEVTPFIVIPSKELQVTKKSSSLLNKWTHKIKKM